MRFHRCFIFSLLTGRSWRCHRRAAASSDDDEFFEKEVRPVLVERCSKMPRRRQNARRSLRSSRRGDAVLQGGDTGRRRAGQAEMTVCSFSWSNEPTKCKCRKEQGFRIMKSPSLRAWVEKGLPYPAAVASVTAGFHITDEQRHFWAFEPVKVGPSPSGERQGLAPFPPWIVTFWRH